MDKRLDAWYAAAAAVKPVIEQHGLKDRATGNVLVANAWFSAVDQHIDQIMRVADWLLEDEEK